MRLDPNFRTLNSALSLTNPGWGGSWAMAVDLCENYAALPPDADPKPVLSCKLRATYYHFDRNDWRYEVLEKEDLPHLDHLRLHRAVWDVDKTEAKAKADAAFAHDLLTRDGYTNVEKAELFDAYIAQKYGYEYLAHEHALRAYKHAKEAIEHDPYEPRLLEILIDPVIQKVPNSNNGFRAERLIEPTMDEMLDYGRRLIVASPYNAEYWEKYASLVERSSPLYGKEEPYRINSIVYSNHELDTLLGYIQSKVFGYDALQKLETGEFKGEEYEAYFKDVEMDADILCPTIRAVRIRDFVCTGSKDYRCENLDPNFEQLLDVMFNDAKTRGACFKERMIPGAHQTYSSTPIPSEWPDGR